MFGCSPPRCLRALFATAAAVVLLIALSPGYASAQQDAGTLRVIVQDPTGVVPGASVVVTNVATNVATTQASNEQGYAIFSPIPRGTYSVSVNLQGFRPVRISDVTIDISQNRLLPVSLVVADIAETVEVTAQAAVIQTEDASLGQVLKSQVIETASAGGPALHRPRPADARCDREHRRPEPARTGMAGGQRQLAHHEQLSARRVRQQPEHAEHAVALGAGGLALAGYARANSR